MARVLDKMKIGWQGEAETTNREKQLSTQDVHDDLILLKNIYSEKKSCNVTS